MCDPPSLLDFSAENHLYSANTALLNTTPDSWTSRVAEQMERQALGLLTRFCGFLKQNSDFLPEPRRTTVSFLLRSEQNRGATGAVCSVPGLSPAL